MRKALTEKQVAEIDKLLKEAAYRYKIYDPTDPVLFDVRCAPTDDSVAYVVFTSGRFAVSSKSGYWLPDEAREYVKAMTKAADLAERLNAVLDSEE